MVWDLNSEIKYIFIHIPKNGGTSIENKLDKIKLISKKFYDNVPIQHLTLPYIKNNLKLKNYDKLIKFTIVRNPYKRLLSDYYWQIKIGCFFLDGKINKKNVKKFTVPKGSFVKNCKKLKNVNLPNFDEFLNLVEDVVMNDKYHENIFYDHFRPQYQFIYDNGNNLADKIFKFEQFDQIQKFIDDICLKNNINTTWKVRNKSNKKTKIVLSLEQKEKIYRIYKLDFDLFNYQN